MPAIPEGDPTEPVPTLRVDTSLYAYRGSDLTWDNWVGERYTLQTSGSTLSSAYTYQMSNAAEATWHTWTTNIVITSGSYTTAAPVPVTAEQRAEREREMAERAAIFERQMAVERERQARNQALWAEAEGRAERLLREFLTPGQLAELERQSAFVVSSELGARFRIKRGWSGNVEELNNDDEIVGRWCIQPEVRVPDADNMLAQKLMLECNEREFRRIGNCQVLVPQSAAPPGGLRPVIRTVREGVQAIGAALRQPAPTPV